VHHAVAVQVREPRGKLMDCAEAPLHGQGLKRRPVGTGRDAGKQRRQRFVQARQHDAELKREAGAAFFGQSKDSYHVFVCEARLQLGFALDLCRESRG
jgi:hypothetical protein